MLLDTHDFIQKANITDEEQKEIITKRYSNLYLEDEAFVGYDIRSEKEFRRALRKDLSNLIKAINKVQKYDNDINIRHCFTPEGEGYFAIWQDGLQARRFVESAYKLTQTGAAWSYVTWRRLLTADTVLHYYLTCLKDKLLVKCEAKTHMEIRHLYLPWILSKEERFVEEFIEQCLAANKYNKIIEGFKAAYAEYRQQMQEEWNEYTSVAQASTTWYNGGENQLYYAVNQFILKTVNEIYRQEDELKNCGMWDKAKEITRILYDICYERDEFAYLKKWNVIGDKTGKKAKD